MEGYQEHEHLYTMIMTLTGKGGLPHSWISCRQSVHTQVEVYLSTCIIWAHCLLLWASGLHPSFQAL